MGLMTSHGKEKALTALKERRDKNKGEDWNKYSSSLTAGSPIYYGCIACNGVAEVKPENWVFGSVKKLCDECQALKDMEWME